MSYENTVSGSAAADTIVFTSANSRLEAGEGANTITGTSGDNLIIAGSGADTITLTTGNNTIEAGGGINTITAMSGNNHITAGEGADTITLTSGNNTIYAGGGINTITATTGDNNITAGDGADTITVSTGKNTIHAGSGANTITASSGDNNITAGDGADTITVSTGNNTIDAGGGINTITASSGINTITTGDGADTITTGGLAGGGNTIYAGNGINTITTGAGNDTVYSGVDADTITTGAGDDRIHIKGGVDTITAGAGNDTLIADLSLATSAVSINGLAGTAAAGYAGNISGLGIATFAGVENFDITSGGFNDVITTGDGSDVVRSGAGSDTVSLGGGNDEAIYTMAANNASIDVYQGGAGVDTLTLEFTTLEWLSADVQADVARYQVFLADHTDSVSGEADSEVFQFNSFKLSASQFEALNVIVDGVALDPNSTTVNDVAELNEDDNATQFDSVLDNDAAAVLAYSVTLISGPSEGILTFNPGTDGAPDGSYSFDPNDDFEDLAEGETRDVSFVYEVQDAYRGATRATVTITVTGTNDKPVILGGIHTGGVEERPDSALGDEMLTTGGTVNFGDVDLLDIHELKFDANGSGYLGTFTAEFSDTATNDGLGEVSWSFEVADSVLNHLYEGQVLFQSYTLILTDDKGGVVTPTVTVRIDGTNDTPVAEIDTAQLLPGGRVELDVLANDSDVDGDRMTISAVTPAGQGTVTIEGNKLVYIADTDASPGVDVVRYTITDPFRGITSATAAFVIGSSQYASATVGSDRSEVLTASDNADIVLGGLGDDTIQAEGGDDLIVWAAGDGNDVIYGGEGFDRLELDLPEDSSDGIRVYADAVGNVIVSGGTFTLTIDGVEDLSFVGGEGGANITFGDLSTTDLANQTIYYRSANGSTANDYMDGGYANKTLHFYGGYGNDTLIGDHFNDVLNGDSGSDVIYGGDGDDRIDGGHHREGGPYPNSPFVPASSVVDMLYGGGGNDTIHGYSARAIVYGGTGIDWIWTGEADDLIWTDGAGTSFINGIEYVQAGGGNDTIYGGNAWDNIFGGSGNDEIYGAEGDDSLSGDAGADTIHGGSGSDLITGGTDADLLYGGGGGIDTLNGGNGNDVIYTESDATSYSYAKGENGNDTIIGGAGRDIVDGGADNDSIEGGGGNDILEGSVGQDTVRGGSGSDLITDISYDTNQLFGNDGNDHIVGIGYIDGGAGNDYIVSRSSFDTVHGGDGDDLIYMDDTIGILSTVNYLYGDAGNDRIQVFSAGTPLYLDGGTGDDNLYILDTPYMGDATLLGGNGNDRLNASSGNDQLFGGSDYGADELWGRGGNDLLDGGYGADTMRGGAGDDVYHYRDIAQDIYESVGGGSDTLISHVVNVTILDEFEFLVLSDGAYHATGNSKNNTITGNGNGNWINGLAGNDVLNGAGGNDWLYAGGGDDTIYGGAGSDTLFAGGQFEWIPNDDRRDSQVLNGGAGADTFSFYGSHFGRYTSVTIQDFNPLEDVLDMSYFGYLDEDVWGNAPTVPGNMSDWEFATQRLSFGPSSTGLGNTTVTAIGLQITLIDVNWHQLDDYNTML